MRALARRGVPRRPPGRGAASATSAPPRRVLDTQDDDRTCARRCHVSGTRSRPAACRHAAQTTRPCFGSWPEGVGWHFAGSCQGFRATNRGYADRDCDARVTEGPGSGRCGGPASLPPGSRGGTFARQGQVRAREVQATRFAILHLPPRFVCQDLPESGGTSERRNATTAPFRVGRLQVIRSSSAGARAPAHTDDSEGIRMPKSKGQSRAPKKGRPVDPARRRYCSFCKEKVDEVDYKDITALRRFVSDRGKIKTRRVERRLPPSPGPGRHGRQVRARDGSAAVCGLVSGGREAGRAARSGLTTR